MTDSSSSLRPVNSLTVEVLTDDVSDAYVSKTLFAVSEFANVVHARQGDIGWGLLCGNLRYGLRLVSQIGSDRHVLFSMPDPKAPFSYAIAPTSRSRWARSNVLQ